MMNDGLKRLKELYWKYKSIILYLFFGVCTTAINMVCYGILYHSFKIGNVTSTVIAWLAAVVFAFITNKRFVFESKRTKVSEELVEFASFFGCRLMTGVLDVVIMVVAVDIMQWNALFWKLVSNVVVTIINYVASKFVIFKKPRQD